MLRFLVALQHRIPGTAVLLVVMKVATVDKPERRGHELESRNLTMAARHAVCDNLRDSPASAGGTAGLRCPR